MVTTDTLDDTAARARRLADDIALWEKVRREAPPADPFDDLGPGEVQFAGTFRAVDWVSRTAQLYVDGDDGGVTTVRFTEAQDGWMRLVATVPVYVKGAMVSARSDASANGKAQPDAISEVVGKSDDGVADEGAVESGYADDVAAELGSCVVDLIQVRVIERHWEPYDNRDFSDVRQGYVYNPETHGTFPFDFDTDEFMRKVRGPGYNKGV